MKKILLILLLLLPGFVVAEDIDKILQERLEISPVGSAISVAVVDENGVRYYNTGKVSKKEGAAAVDENTVYEIGSITKVFTGALLAEAINRGEVKLNDPISMYLPEGNNAPTFDGKEITLFDLTTHGSSLPSLPDNLEMPDPKNPYATYKIELVYEFLNRVELEREIGSQFEYSNLAVGLLGIILSEKAGMNYEELVTTRILVPLEMNDTVMTFTPELKSRLALGHDAAGEQTSNWDLPALAGAGALRSTAVDMAKFLSANLGLKEVSLAGSLAEARKVEKTYEKPPVRIGFNWITSDGAGTDIVWHNGGTGGYRAFAGLAEKQKKGVFVVTNGSDSVDDLGMHLLNNEVPLRAPVEPKVAITLDEDVLEQYVGDYQFSPEFSIVVTREGPQLFGQPTKQGVSELFAEKMDGFFLKTVPASITFTRDENGEVDGAVLHQGGGEMPAKKVK